MVHFIFKSFTILSLIQACHLYSGKDVSTGIHDYESIGCTGIYDVEGIYLYNCSSILSPASPGTCFYKGVTYFHQQYIPKNDLDDCICHSPVGTNEISTLLCHPLYCEGDKHVPTGCVNTYNTIDSICPSDFVCDTDTNVAACKYGKKQYLEGQVFYTEGYPCHACQCNSNFTTMQDSIQNGLCRPVTCSTPEPSSGCAPIFIEDTCCPDSWYCPKMDENVKIITTNIKVPGNSGEKCKFGDIELGENDVMITQDICLKCVCKHPPYVFCYEDESCKH